MNAIISNVKVGSQEVTLWIRSKKTSGKHFICNDVKGYFGRKEQRKSGHPFCGVTLILTLLLDRSDSTDVLVTRNRHRYLLELNSGQLSLIFLFRFPRRPPPDPLLTPRHALNVYNQNRRLRPGRHGANTASSETHVVFLLSVLWRLGFDRATAANRPAAGDDGRNTPYIAVFG